MTALPDPPAGQRSAPDTASDTPSDAATGVPTDPLVTVLHTTITAARTARVPLTELRAAFARADPSGATLPDARARLAAAITVLHDQQEVVLPSQARGARGWERHLSPPLPLWVQRPAATPAVPVQAPARVWRPELTAAAEIARTASEWDVLDRVDRWLATRPRAATGDEVPRVPFRERSLEVFGDEKRLEALLRTRLFTAGALSLELLCADVPPLPLAVQWATMPEPGSPAGPLILTENHHTFASLLRAARSRVEEWGPVAVGYGSGNQLTASVTGILQLQPLPGRVLYVGDVDVAGLHIAARVTSAAAGLPVPRVEPAVHLYRVLFDRDLRGPGRLVSAELATAAAGWLEAPDLVERAAALLQAGDRLAQEALGLEVLLGLDRLV